MRWLHGLLHWRCDRELAQREAIIAALMPRYQPVIVPSEPLAATIQRQIVREETKEALDGDGARAKQMASSYRDGVRFVEAEK